MVTSRTLTSEPSHASTSKPENDKLKIFDFDDEDGDVVTNSSYKNAPTKHVPQNRHMYATSGVGVVRKVKTRRSVAQVPPKKGVVKGGSERRSSISTSVTGGVSNHVMGGVSNHVTGGVSDQVTGGVSDHAIRRKRRGCVGDKEGGIGKVRKMAVTKRGSDKREGEEEEERVGDMIGLSEGVRDKMTRKVAGGKKGNVNCRFSDSKSNSGGGGGGGGGGGAGGGGAGGGSLPPPIRVELRGVEIPSPPENHVDSRKLPPPSHPPPGVSHSSTGKKNHHNLSPPQDVSSVTMETVSTHVAPAASVRLKPDYSNRKRAGDGGSGGGGGDGVGAKGSSLEVLSSRNSVPSKDVKEEDGDRDLDILHEIDSMLADYGSVGEGALRKTPPPSVPFADVHNDLNIPLPREKVTIAMPLCVWGHVKEDIFVNLFSENIA